MSLSVLLLGFGLGLIFVLPPGPVAVTLVEVGARHGRAAGVRSGIGIAAGDLVVASLAAALVLAGSVLPPTLFETIQFGSSLALVALGFLLVARPTVAEAVASVIQRPGRTLFAMTVLTPTVFGAWVALIAALPFSADRHALVGFIIGATVASIAWHVGLGSAAAEVGARLPTRAMQWVARAGGLLMMGLGLATLVG